MSSPRSSHHRHRAATCSAIPWHSRDRLLSSAPSARRRAEASGARPICSRWLEVRTEAAELTASDGATSDSPGCSGALSASGVAVGAPFHTVSAQADQGAAYLYSTALTVSPAPATATATNAASKNSPGCQHHITAYLTPWTVPAGISSTLSRTPRSRVWAALDPPGPTISAGLDRRIFGYGWSSSYESNLVVNSDGRSQSRGGRLASHRDTGRTGGFAVPSWADSTLTSSGARTPSSASNTRPSSTTHRVSSPR